MTTITDIGTFFYELLNVAELTSLLNGGAIYRNQRPKNSTKNDIVVLTTFQKDDFYTGVHVGEVKIVLIINKIADLPDTLTQLSIEEKVIELLKNSNEKQTQKEKYFEMVETSEYDNYEGQTMYSSLYINLKTLKIK